MARDPSFRRNRNQPVEAPPVGGQAPAATPLPESPQPPVPQPPVPQPPPAQVAPPPLPQPAVPQLLPPPPDLSRVPVRPDNGAMNDLVARLVDAKLQPGMCFYLLVLPEDAWFQLLTFSTVQELIAAINARLGGKFQLVPFLGHHMPITKGPNRFLRTPMGMLPLFQLGTAVEDEPLGWVGDEPLEPEDDMAIPTSEEPAEVPQPQPQLQVPPPAPAMAQSTQVADADVPVFES